MCDEDELKSVSFANNLRLTGEFCDAVIKVEDVEFPVHKVLLCNCSSYFRVLFRRWSIPEQKEFPISGVSPDTMRLIIEFVYTGSITVTEQNVKDLLQAAEYFNINNMKGTCSTFLEEHLSVENCTDIWRFANTFHPFPAFQQKAFLHIINHFEELAPSKKFVHFTVQELGNLIELDELNVKKEETVFEAVLEWIKHDAEARKGHMAGLLSKVRLALLPVDYVINKVITNELIVSDTNSLILVENVTRIMNAIRFISPDASGFSNLVARPRLPKVSLLAIGGLTDWSRVNTIVAYDIRVNRWVTVTCTLPNPHNYYCIVFLGGNLYCVGGLIRYCKLIRVQRFNLSTQTWHYLAPMNDFRLNAGITAVDGRIYAVGGYNGRHHLNSAECFIAKENQWISIAPMTERRSEPGCTALENKIYVCGGFNGIDSLRSVECYHPDNNHWTMIRPMMTRRSGLGVIAYTDHVYAVGGSDGFRVLCSVEAYNPTNNTWQEVTSMLSPRRNFGIAVVEDFLFIVGGLSEQTYNKEVEYYHAMSGKWSLAADTRNLCVARGCCVVSGLPKMSNFLFPRDCLPRIP
ncbi:kelch-like protein 10 isoform 1-T1 [Synchiropus picturatus]